MRLDGDVLLGPTGTPYGLQPGGEDLLVGGRGASAGQEMWRYSRATVFESGKVSLTLPSLVPLQATQDVCAVKSFEALGGAGAEPIVSTVMIAAPYQGTHAEIRMILPRHPSAFPYTVRAGEFVVRDRAGLLQSPDSSIQVELWSPAFAAVYGQNAVQISTGNVRVVSAGNGVYAFEGWMRTASGVPVSFSAEVTLERRP